jgi:hypothetical protein
MIKNIKIVELAIGKPKKSKIKSGFKSGISLLIEKKLFWFILAL